jgi:hypothetical protein
MMPAERMMTLNFLYAAHTYIDDWVAYDRKAHEVLGIDSGALPEAAQAYEQLLRVAKGYAVMRNFNMEDGGIARLAPGLRCRRLRRRFRTRMRRLVSQTS